MPHEIWNFKSFDGIGKCRPKKVERFQSQEPGDPLSVSLDLIFINLILAMKNVEMSNRPLN